MESDKTKTNAEVSNQLWVLGVEIRNKFGLILRMDGFICFNGFFIAVKSMTQF